MRPVERLDQTDFRVTDRTVLLSYNNIWSLVDFIRRHRARPDDFAGLVDPHPHTLRIEVPTQQIKGGDVGSARVFIRVELAAQMEGRKSPLLMPYFPFEAPKLSP